MSCGERLSALLKALGKSQAEIAADWGTNQQQISRIVRGGGRVREDFAAWLSESYDVNLNWLLTGRGPMFLSEQRTDAQASPAGRQEGAGEGTPDGGSLNDGRLLQELREHLLRLEGRSGPQIVAIVDDRRAFERLEGSEKFRAIPYMRDAAAAGNGRIVEDQVEGYVVVHEGIAPRPADLVAVQVAGDSMLPTLTDGSIVAIDVAQSDPAPLRSKIVCARTEANEVVIKRLGAAGRDLVLTSDNLDKQEFPPITVRLEAVANPIIGRVVWAWVDLR